MDDHEVFVPTEYFLVRRGEPVQVIRGELVYPTSTWARRFVDDILMKLAMENAIAEAAVECNCILWLARPSGRKSLLVVRDMARGQRLLMHGCPRCDKDFLYEGAVASDCVATFYAQGSTMVCPKCG